MSEVVISRMSGRFPLSEDFEEFWENLMNGMNGSNTHAINGIGSNLEKASKLPKLVGFSGRSEESLTHAFAKVEENKTNAEFISLLHKIGEEIIPGHPYRGYTILYNESEKQIVDIIEIEPTESQRPLWFVLSGMGTLWFGMMEGLMEFGIFAQSVHRSAEITAKFGLNLVEIMESDDQEVLDDNMGICFVAMGIALIELLDSIGVKPDGFLGHSAGELLCSYLDGCISQEEALTCYYHKDVAVLTCCGGAMASIGLTWEDAKTRCPPGVYPACHNGLNNVTVAGSEDKIHQFIAELKADGIFAREVSTGGIAYHSPYLQSILPSLSARVQATARNTKLRSNRWISTSIPEDEWASASSIKTGAADYVMNNIKSPVLFHDALKHIPENAVVLEVSAHSLFVSMLKKALPPTCDVLGLMRKGAGANELQILTAVGKLYQMGYSPRISGLYEPPTFPVAANTPKIDPLIKWDHGISK